MYALHMSMFNIEANREIYDCIKNLLFPMISKELKKMHPDTHELFRNSKYNQYLEIKMKKLYFENVNNNDYILELKKKNAKITNDLKLAQSELENYLFIFQSIKLVLCNMKRKLNKNTFHSLRGQYKN